MTYWYDLSLECYTDEENLVAVEHSNRKIFRSYSLQLAKIIVDQQFQDPMPSEGVDIVDEPNPQDAYIVGDTVTRRKAYEEFILITQERDRINAKVNLLRHRDKN